MTVAKNSELHKVVVKEGSHLWIDKYADYLYSYAMSRLNDEEMAKDLVQETFLSALENANRFEGRSTEKTWLTAILKHKLFDVYRARCKAVEVIKEPHLQNPQKIFFEKDGHWKIPDQPQPFSTEQADALDSKEFQNILLQCMQKLPALWTTIFSMKFMDGEQTASICKELKVSAANYWVIIHRAKINLRSCLQKNWL